MLNELLNSGCIDYKHPLTCKGAVATYYLQMPAKNAENIKVKKFDADCVKNKLKVENKIVDAFFLIYKGGGNQRKEKWILVEAKGDKFQHGIQQLSKSLEIFIESGIPAYGRLVTKGVPNIIKNDEETKLFNELLKKFIKTKGDLKRGNKQLKEQIVSFDEFKIVV
jgi:hypothetical protein